MGNPTESKTERINQILAGMAAISEFAEGCLSKSSNYSVRGGVRHKAKPHWKFQSRGGAGRRVCRAVPAALVPRIRELVENGKRYRALEREYAALVTEASVGTALAEPSKKTTG
jgi:hypothetical protein